MGSTTPQRRSVIMATIRKPRRIACPSRRQPTVVLNCCLRSSSTSGALSVETIASCLVLIFSTPCQNTIPYPPRVRQSAGVRHTAFRRFEDVGRPFKTLVPLSTTFSLVLATMITVIRLFGSGRDRPITAVAIRRHSEASRVPATDRASLSSSRAGAHSRSKLPYV